MAREKRNVTKVSYNLDNELLAQLKEYSRDAGRYETRVIEMALKEFFEKHKDEIEDVKS